jgi:hypothetical protein
LDFQALAVRYGIKTVAEYGTTALRLGRTEVRPRCRDWGNYGLRNRVRPVFNDHGNEELPRPQNDMQWRPGALRPIAVTP